jgi:hypothetical protein
MVNPNTLLTRPKTLEREIVREKEREWEKERFLKV